MHAYNLFRSKGPNPLVCAVPEERSVPGFVTSRTWEFSGRFDGNRDAPVGFDSKAAVTGVRFNGFYIFSDFRPKRV